MLLKQLDHIISVLSPLYQEYEVDVLQPSLFAKEHLYYLYLAHSFNVRFPFYIDCLPFDAYLIIFTREGEGLLTYADEKYVLTPNTVIFVDCHQPFRLELSKAATWSFEAFILNGPNIDAYYHYFAKSNYHPYFVTPISNMTQIIHKLLQLKIRNPNHNDFIISKLITDLLTELMLTTDVDSQLTPNLPKYLIQIKSLFDEHYTEHFNLDELAQTYHISKYKIIRDFSIYFHNSPINYLIEKRISAAKHLLLETDYPICEIASMVGIDNINHFTNLFKKNTHLTPNYYRKKCQMEFIEYLDE